LAGEEVLGVFLSREILRVASVDVSEEVIFISKVLSKRVAIFGLNLEGISRT
jgi:hypothetical protein